MFFILGISISIFLGFLLLIKKNKSNADYILIAWLLYIAFHQLLNYYLDTNELYNYPHWLGVEIPMPLLHGIFLFFYVLKITDKKLKKRWYILLHFLPTLFLIFLLLPFYSLTGPEKIMVFKNEGKGYENLMLFISILVPLSGLLYTAWSFHLIKKHQSDIQDNLSNTDKKELQWLKYLSLGLGIIWLLAVFFESVVIFSGVVIFVLFIGFFGINQMAIFTSSQKLATTTLLQQPPPTDKDKTDSPKKTVQKRYAKSGLTEEKANQIHTDLKQLMERELLFQNNNITLLDLAKQLQVHPNHLSQVINEKEQKKFYNYINALRIQAFIKLANLPENKKYTLLALAYQCGFNAKSTFNKHFKENTGKTPSQYFKSQITDL